MAGHLHWENGLPNGNEAALTFHIIIQSKKVITLPIEIIDRSCRMAAFVCLCHCVIKTQKFDGKTSDLDLY